MIPKFPSQITTIIQAVFSASGLLKYAGGVFDVVGKFTPFIYILVSYACLSVIQVISRRSKALKHRDVVFVTLGSLFVLLCLIPLKMYLAKVDAVVVKYTDVQKVEHNVVTGGLLGINLDCGDPKYGPCHKNHELANHAKQYQEYLKDHWRDFWNNDPHVTPEQNLETIWRRTSIDNEQTLLNRYYGLFVCLLAVGLSCLLEAFTDIGGEAPNKDADKNGADNTVSKEPEADVNEAEQPKSGEG